MAAGQSVWRRVRAQWENRVVVTFGRASAEPSEDVATGGRGGGGPVAADDVAGADGAGDGGAGDEAAGDGGDGIVETGPVGG